MLQRDHPYTIRLSDREHDALRRAAEADDRRPAPLARRIIIAWLAEHGWLERQLTGHVANPEKEIMTS